MVVALGPGKFYGSSLPRPRIYPDVKLNDERVDPPVPVLGPLMSWAEEAHWSMGGLNVKRLRFQGRIEGNIMKIRADHERFVDKIEKQAEIDEFEAKFDEIVKLSPSPPPAPFVVKRKRRFLVDEEDSEGDEREVIKCGPARKLCDDFDKVAVECGMKEVSESEGIATKSRSGRFENGTMSLKGKKLNAKEKSKRNGEKMVKISPRLAKHG